MSPEKIRERLLHRPFEPLRVVTSSGESYEIIHPDAALLTQGSLVIGLGKQKEGLYSDTAYVSLLHVTAVEPLVKRNGRRHKRGT